MKVSCKENLLAESDETIVVKGDYFMDSDTNTVCPWKRWVSCYNLKIGSEQIEDAAWYYRGPVMLRSTSGAL